MTLEIISAEQILFSGDVDSVTLPGELGSFTVLRNHASIISALVKGQVVYKKENKEPESIDIDGGVVDVENNKISVCVY